MKKKSLALLLAVILTLAPSAFAIDLYVDEEKLVTDTEPMITQNRTIVPVRAIFEALGAEVLWDGAERSVTATKDDITIYLKIDDTTAYVNGEAKILDVPAQIKNNRTMVPARFVSEALNADVQWDGETRTVYITTVPGEDTPIPAPTPTPTPTPAPVPTPDPEPDPQPQQGAVYVTPAGKRYHYDPDCGGKNSYASTLDSATSRGLTPCKKCAQ